MSINKRNQNIYSLACVSPGEVDELDYCEPTPSIVNRMNIYEKIETETNKRREKFNKSKSQRKRRHSNIALSISNNASALFTHSQIKNFDRQVSAYQNIANLTQQENDNLKQQNQYLLKTLEKMNTKNQQFKKIVQKAKYYKALYLQANEELSMIRQKCQAYKRKAQQMKNIALGDIYQLQEKLLPVQTADDSQSNQSYAYSSPNLLSDEQQNNGMKSYIAKSN